MEFGIFSNGERSNQLAADTYDEDLYEIQVADKLGLKEAWVSEHVPRGDGSSRPDTVPVADLLICKAAAITKQIRLGPAVRPISFYQPMQAAMFKLWSSYSARDLKVITDFIARSTDLSVACVEKIRDGR